MQLDPIEATGRVGLVVPTVLLTLLLLAWLPATVLARDEPPAASLEEAVAQVERAHGGRILSARSERSNDRVVYRIRLLTQDQQVRTFEIPGAEGAQP
ncbi:PepSY domain-containing protein [Thioalkalivibrio paradoxus]|uniref:Ribosome biogenesis GTPase n=1 Tax=Thioalkalivibrio paradoxus ARh 1 TaxID=713585 RepID=W0DK94_9GAMM|nr:PepSY domain-containing protein [Thioalkalivibrio paradoxus]AHE97305.1 ribosome biogenesis GTPase [Thioalkalivibrio paradoxus ARh 1]